MCRDFVASMFPFVRVKCLIAAGSFDECLGKLHRYSGKHIWSDMSKPIRGRNLFLSNMKVLVKHFIAEPLKSVLKENCSVLFQKLRLIKKKLKGELLNCYRLENKH